MMVALGSALAVGFAASPVAANAAISSASITGTTATLNFDGADDNATVSVSGGLLVHNASGGGVNSASDWNSGTVGDQTVAADGTFTVALNGGDGNDTLTVVATNTQIAGTTINGDGGNDILTGAETNDTLNGGPGNDRLVGFRGNDAMNGGDGDDTLVWNNGDGSDVMNGEAGTDTTEVNGAGAAGDQFTVNPNGDRVRFDRVNLGLFSLDIGTTENLVLNGGGGDDTMTGAAGLAALIRTTMNGGDGNDGLTGTDGADTQTGGAGNDRLVGFRGQRCDERRRRR